MYDTKGYQLAFGMIRVVIMYKAECNQEHPGR
jgi:hypothetical protein